MIRVEQHPHAHRAILTHRDRGDIAHLGEILHRRRVRWVAVYRPVQSFVNSRQILTGPGADPTINEKDFYRYVLLRLWDFKMVPTRFQIVYASEDWKLYRYDP